MDPNQDITLQIQEELPVHNIKIEIQAKTPPTVNTVEPDIPTSKDNLFCPDLLEIETGSDFTASLRLIVFYNLVKDLMPPMVTNLISLVSGFFKQSQHG